MGHARAIAGIEDLPLQLSVFKQIISKSLSVRATEQLIKSYHSNKKTAKPSSNPTISAEVAKIRDRISGFIGSKVDIKRNNKGAGQIVIKFNSDKEFNNIIDVLDELEK
jgi:ParB family chromosome partitioning protein